jgi:glutathione synthase/RimK-type ligase-like ATP-grasp enzyme
MKKAPPIKYDIVILTDKRYDHPKKLTPYIENVLKEDRFIQEALEALGYTVWRTYWDHPTFDWSTTQAVLFRTTWDYFNRFEEFFSWLNQTKTQTRFINTFDLIYWNIDKHYLKDLSEKGIRIVPTHFIEIGNTANLNELIAETNWQEVIVKPAISGTARHTYKIQWDEIEKYESVFKTLIAKESMLIQPFMKNITSKGEVALILFGGKFSHAILKKAKEGDFRVQDDFGGSVYDYKANESEIEFAEKVIAACPTLPIYARVDVIWNDENEICVSEVECIEPELWMRKSADAPKLFAQSLLELTKLEPLKLI